MKHVDYDETNEDKKQKTHLQKNGNSSQSNNWNWVIQASVMFFEAHDAKSLQ